jgi:hypothetical protein
MNSVFDNDGLREGTMREVVDLEDSIAIDHVCVPWASQSGVDPGRWSPFAVRSEPNGGCGAIPCADTNLGPGNSKSVKMREQPHNAQPVVDGRKASGFVQTPVDYRQNRNRPEDRPRPSKLTE